MNKKYDKYPSKSSKDIFVQYLNGHTRVTEVEDLGNHIYRVSRKNLPDIKVAHSNIYILSEADVHELQSSVENLNAIVLVGHWNSYSISAKELGKRNSIGIFQFREFFGAINYEDDKFINYILPENKEGNKKK